MRVIQNKLVNQLKIIFEGDKFAQKILGAKRIQPNTVYRWSDYAVQHIYDGKRYLYHNFTKVLAATDEAVPALSREARFDAAAVSSDKNLTWLVEQRFLVPEQKDETAEYVGFCKVARLIKLKRTGYTGFTILPTTACNARCVYCYEQGMKYVTMTEETVAQAIAFIKKVRDPDKKLTFRWFGGEPLMGEKIIDKICAALREEDIDFRSTMVSNGSLINDKIIKKMIDDWHLDSIQITLDGVEDEYNRRKNYYFNYDSAYWHVLSRIKMVNDAGIRLNIRVNIDEGNVGGVSEMFEDVKNFISKPELVTVDLAPLFDLQSSEEGLAIWDKSFTVSDELAEHGFRKAGHYNFRNARFNFCMADMPYRSVVISPEGKLYNCEHLPGQESEGDVWNGFTNTALIKERDSVESPREKCVGCTFLPECTTFSHCPNSRVDCRFACQKHMDRMLDRMIPYYLSEAEKPAEEDTEEETTDNC